MSLGNLCVLPAARHHRREDRSGVGKPCIPRRERDLPANARTAPPAARPRRHVRRAERSDGRPGKRRRASASFVALGPGSTTGPSSRAGRHRRVRAVAWPEAPQLFVAHSVIHDLQLTDSVPPNVAAIVALNDRSAARASALAADIPVVRLRQPIDVGHFTPGPPPRDRPRTLLILGNNNAAWRTSSLHRECDRRGIDVSRVGGDARLATRRGSYEQPT